MPKTIQINISRKKLYLQREILNSRNDEKKFWTIVKTLTPEKRLFQTPYTIIVNATKLICPNAIVETFNEYFCNIGTKPADNIPSKRKNDLKKSLNRNQSFMYPKSITNFEVFNQINQLNTSKGCGY